MGGFDHHERSWIDDPYPTYDRLRDDQPVAWSDAHGGFWLLTRHADVKAALHDWTTYTSAVPGRIAIPPTTPSSVPSVPLESDPPEHSAYRRALAHAFSQREVDRFEGVVVAHAERLVAACPPGQPFDVVRSVAVPLVGHAIAAFLGFPTEDLERIERWADAIFAHRVRDPEGAKRAQTELLAYVAQALRLRAGAPRSSTDVTGGVSSTPPDDDVLSRVAALRIGERPATEAEKLGFARLLLLAGREATIDAIGNAIAYLADDPTLRRHLATTPASLPAAVEEFLRLEAPIQLLGRVAKRTVTVHGCEIEAGQTVAMGFGAAGRDPRTYADPATFDVERFEVCPGTRPAPRHLAFGSGPHACMGAHLARSCLRVALAAFLRQIPDFDVVEATRKPNGDARGWTRLVVRQVVNPPGPSAAEACP